MIWTSEIVIHRLIRAADTMRRLPGGRLRPTGFISAWPAVRDEWADQLARVGSEETRGRDRPRLSPPRPGEIDRMYQCMDWMTYVDDLEHRRALMIYCRDKALGWRFSRSCKKLGWNRRTAYNRKDKAAQQVASGLNNMTVPLSQADIDAVNRLDGNCTSAGVGGIGVDDAEKNVVACNIVTDSPTAPGIKTQNNEGSSQRNAFVGNVISGNGTYGLHLATNSDKVSIENTAIGNVLYNNTSGALKVDASSVDNVMTGNVASREVVDVVNQNHTVTEPVSFMVSLNTTQINVTGNGTLYKIPFNTEVRDYGSNFDLITNNNFIAPVTGRYIFSGGARVEGGASTIEWVQVVVVTSNRSYRSEIQMTNESVAAPTICVLVDMQRGHTAHLSVRAGGMGVDNAEVSNDTQQTFFSGELLG